MRLNQKKIDDTLLKLVIIGVVFSIIFSVLSILTLRSTPTGYIEISLVFLGLLLVSGIGLLFDLNSKGSGILILALVIPVSIYFLVLSYANTAEVFIIAIIIGGAFNGYFIMNNQFDRLSSITKFLLKFLLIILLFGVLYNYFIDLADVSLAAMITDYSSTDTDHGKLNLISHVISIALLVGLYFVLSTNIRGIRASEVFVFGPRGSGKTFFLVGMYNQFVDFFEGSHKEVVFCGNKKEESLWKLSTLLGNVEAGVPLPSNVTDMVSIYSLRGKRYGIKPIDFTIVDYAGELVHELQDKINPKIYQERLEKLSKDLDIDINTLENKTGTIEFLENLKENKPDIIPSIIEDLVITFIYKRLFNAGKIIFLIDGAKILNFEPSTREEMTNLFGYYEEIMDVVGKNKQYAFVVTKTDKIVPIFNIPENSPDAAEVEENIYQKLHTIGTFRAIENQGIDIPIYFFTVSVNGMNVGEDNTPGIFPWRYNEVAKFEF